jgi:protein-disulfide isomerase
MKMRIYKLYAVLATLAALCPASALAQPGSVSGKNPPTATTASGSLQSPLTKEQGEEILNELRLIRQALEDRGERPAAAPTAATGPAPAAKSEKVVVAVSPGWHAIGRTDAPVTLIEFADYQCPFCRKFHSTTFPELKRDYIDTGKVRFISRDLPLQFHPNAAPAALAVRCAGAQGKYWEMREALIGGEARLEQAALESDAENLHLQMDAYRVCMKNDEYSAAIQQDAADARSLGISGTPSFIIGTTTTDGKSINGVRLEGAMPYSNFATEIDAALSHK